MSAKPVFLIVGASLAGAKAAEELRTQGFDGRVVLIGAAAAAFPGARDLRQHHPAGVMLWRPVVRNPACAASGGAGTRPGG